MAFALGSARAGFPARVAAAVTVLASAGLFAAGAAPPDASLQTHDAADRAARRIEALQREADELARRERSLLGELRAFEIEREIQAERLRDAERRLAAVDVELGTTTARIRALESSASTQGPELAARLVELYKLRNGGYLRLLLNVGDAHNIGRAYRFATAMQAIDARRLDEYRRTVADLRRAELSLRDTQAHLAELKASATKAAAAAAAAAAARHELVDRIDARRDLNARLVGELQVARERLQRQVDDLPGAAPAALPIEPFHGDLDWPVEGRVLSDFGRPRDPRAKASILNNGIQVGAPFGTPVQVIHEGRVSFAAPFEGFGNLVIVDHGGLAYSLYGQLSDIAVEQGQELAKGAVVGGVGSSVDGAPALYFELRIDAQPVDPLQWLKRR